MQSVRGLDDYKISFVMSVNLTFLCPQSSAISTMLGMDAQNPKKILFGVLIVLPSFWLKSEICVYYKSDINFRLYAAILDFDNFSRQLLNCLTDPFEIWHSTLNPAMFRLSKIQRFWPQAGDHLEFLKSLTYKPLNRSFRNLVIKY
jgi:hypothetical protein